MRILGTLASGIAYSLFKTVSSAPMRQSVDPEEKTMDMTAIWIVSGAAAAATIWTTFQCIHLKKCGCCQKKKSNKDDSSVAGGGENSKLSKGDGEKIESTKGDGSKIDSTKPKPNDVKVPPSDSVILAKPKVPKFAGKPFLDKDGYVRPGEDIMSMDDLAYQSLADVPSIQESGLNVPPGLLDAVSFSHQSHKVQAKDWIRELVEFTTRMQTIGELDEFEKDCFKAEEDTLRMDSVVDEKTRKIMFNKTWRDPRIGVFKSNQGILRDGTETSYSVIQDFMQREFLVGQAPLKGEYQKQWDLIWELEVGIIVWAGPLLKMGSHFFDPYCPTKIDEELKCGPFTISAENVVPEKHFVGLSVKKDGVSRSRVIGLYSLDTWKCDNWTDKEALSMARALTEIDTDRAQREKYFGLRRTLVHDSNGIDYSVSFIFAMLLRQAWYQTGAVDLFKLMKYIRKCRLSALSSMFLTRGLVQDHVLFALSVVDRQCPNLVLSFEKNEKVNDSTAPIGFDSGKHKMI